MMTKSPICERKQGSSSPPLFPQEQSKFFLHGRYHAGNLHGRPSHKWEIIPLTFRGDTLCIGLERPKNSSAPKKPMKTISVLGAGKSRFTEGKMKAESSLYRCRGKPECSMAEIRRTLLRSILAQLEKERQGVRSMKKSASLPRIHKDDEIKSF